MEWYWWVIIIFVALIVIGQFVGSYIGFRFIIPKKPRSSSLLERDLDTPDFSDKKDLIIENINFMNNLSYNEENIISKDKLNLYGGYLDNNSDTTVIFVHGYRSNPFNDFNCPMRKMYDKGFNILWIDQRCHGKSEGKYVTFGIKERIDILYWIKHINKKYNPKNIILYGMSMGCASSAMSLPLLPSNVKCAILDCGYSSVYKLMVKQTKQMIKVDAHIPVLVMNLYCMFIARFSMFKTSPQKALKKTNIPCFFIHGTMDKTIPYEHTQENYACCNSDIKEISIVEDAGHGKCYYIDHPNLEEKIIRFIEEILVK